MTTLTGTAELVRLAVRRDRVIVPLWMLLFVSMAWVSADATIGLYPDVASRVAAAETINGTPSLVALYGWIYDTMSLGAVAMIKMGGLGAALLSVLAIVLVVRHTRAEEESGRLELVSGGVVGRYASLTAALVLAGGAVLLVGVLTAVALVAAGLPAAGATAFGLAWAATGLAFAGVGAVAAQLTVSARAATGLASAVLGGAYLLRAVGDASGSGGPTWLSWLSPVGWGQQVRPFAGDRWAVLLLLLGSAVLLVTAAYALVGRRDLGAGLLPDRPGPANAGPRLSTALGLAWRLHRGSLVAWTAGFAVLGLVFGNVASNAGSFLQSEAARELFTRLGGEKGIVDAFLATELGFMGIFASAYGVQAAMRMRTEENALRAEPLLATRVGRVEWAASHVTVAVLGTTLLLVTAGLAAGAAHAAQTGEAADVTKVLGAALVHLPAALVLAGIVVAAFGLAPQLVAAGWAALVVFLVIGELGPLLELPQWVMDVSPFAHVPKLPGSELLVAPLAWLTAVAVALGVAGLAGFRRRDVGAS